MKTHNDIQGEIIGLAKEIDEIKEGRVFFSTPRQEKAAINRIKIRIEWLKVLKGTLLAYSGRELYLTKVLSDLENQKKEILSQYESVRRSISKPLSINEFKRLRGVPEIDKKIKGLQYIHH